MFNVTVHVTFKIKQVNNWLPILVSEDGKINVSLDIHELRIIAFICVN